ncbi:hypothetical protein AURDEDRAFT_145675 [Auricularia subglabra TFB-10046 SS5]|nr:hypothetical protein AURDEDRAFT_145675 [Auricularia subglabra TFB-10046 SS5]
MLRARLDNPNLSAWDDWRRWRVAQFFREIHGFHQGNLDMSGRPKTRYDALLRRLLPLVTDLGSLLPLVETVAVEREEVDVETVKLVKKTALVPFVRDAAAWNDFCRKWNVPRTIDYEDMVTSLSETLRVLL